MDISRRSFLAGLGGALAVPNLTQAAGAIDLNEPDENLRAFVKLIGALDTEPVYDLVRGSVYALRPGRPAEPLFKTLGAGVARFRAVSAREYHSTSYYVGMLLDWRSEERLDGWENPLNGRRCEVPVTRYGPGGSTILGGEIVPDGMAADRTPQGIWPWYRLGDVAHMERVVLQDSVRHPLYPKADLMTYTGDWRLLVDPSVKRMPSRLNFTAVESWRPWMEMSAEENPGTLWWQVAGAKLATARDYPESVRRKISAVAADFFEH